ncbi:hypothetical protein [Massilia sp. 9096]|uniref:hypothetical protein n=1 Tax=Massilia sp. 9096 TaxID=1500894 RepID=UPI000565D845|nr:hypothetical protein [Massilia sp. 9096]
MHARLLAPILLTLATASAAAHAQDTVGFGHRITPAEGQASGNPIAWDYKVLRAAQDVFDERVGAHAPGATLAFRLPKPALGQDGNQVEIVRAGHRATLTMVSNDAFALTRDAAVAQAGAVVKAANRNFDAGSYNEPVVQVRSPGLADNVRRLGDLRLACAAQMAMLKAEGFKVKAMLSVTNLFGLDLCDDTKVMDFDKPAGRFDTVTIEDGEHRLVLPARQSKAPRLGDKDWSDDARITYSMDEHDAK